MSQDRETIRWFNHAAGHGFLTRDPNVDVFMHYAAVKSGGYRVLRKLAPLACNTAAFGKPLLPRGTRERP